MSAQASAPLAGIRVLDASRVLAGPFCAQTLGDLGAEVIKVEQPGTGDETRGWGPPFHGALSAYFLSCNRNKRGITLDLSTASGRSLFRQLVARCDVVLENFRAASAEKLGLTPKALFGHNPRLIICSISGYGRTGAWSDLPGYDFAIQAQSGLMNVTGPVEGPPCKIGVALTDILTGLYAAVGIVASLRAREQSGHGYALDLALFDCAVAAQVNLAQAYLTSGVVPARQGNAHLQIVPYQLFATKDSWLVLAVGNDGQWERFCRVANRADLAADARFATNLHRVENRSLLIPILEQLLKTKTTQRWQELLREAQVPAAPVWDYEQVFRHPHAEERGLRIRVHDSEGNPIDLVGSPFHIAGADAPAPTAPPRLGEHTEQILRELLSLSDEQIAELRREGSI